MEKLTTLPSKTAVHCETQEEFDRIIKIIPFDIAPSVWNNWFKSKTCIEVLKYDWQFDSIDYFTSEGYTIITSTKIE